MAGDPATAGAILSSLFPNCGFAMQQRRTPYAAKSVETFYVLACMETNGQNAEGLQKCSCAINAIEVQLSYEQYSEAVLVFALRQAGGEQAAIYRDAVAMREIADWFIGAQTRANR